MRQLTASDVLDLWSAGGGDGTTERALAVLAAGGAGTVEELAALPLGELDRRLLELRARTFARPLECRTACPGCGEELEAEVEPRGLERSAPPRRRRRRRGGLEAELRPVTAADLLAAGAAGDPAAAALVVAERCVGSLRRGGEPAAVRDLDAGELAALSELLAAADPAAETLLALGCAACGRRWQEPLDVAAFFLAELDLAARRLLAEIHLLARAYGWRESDVLALPAWRRAAYRELVLAEGIA